MLTPMPIPQGGFNQEYRQHPQIPGGYIFSYTGDNYNEYLNDIYPLLPESVTFAHESTPSDFQRDEPGSNAVPQTAVLFPYPGEPLAGMPWRFTLLAGKRTIDFTLIARILSKHPILKPGESSDSTTTKWHKGLIERRTETKLLAVNGAKLTELVGTEGDRYALVASFSGQSTNDLPPPPPGYQYEFQEMKQDFQLICLRYAHILINNENGGGFNFQRYERGGVID
ncbi:MAG TPA: hypothetical protein VKZ53_00500 [Candidatus Angelobacter sp.]|nr:hypothetical protein [Candidatus Angelobacter sp.]